MADRKGMLDWPAIVNHVVTVLISGLLLGAAGLLTWGGKTLLNQMQEITELKAQIAAAKEVDDGLQEIYARELFELRRELEEMKGEKPNDDGTGEELPVPPEPDWPDKPEVLPLPKPPPEPVQMQLDYEAELRGKLDRAIRAKK